MEPQANKAASGTLPSQFFGVPGMGATTQFPRLLATWPTSGTTPSLFPLQPFAQLASLAPETLQASAAVQALKRVKNTENTPQQQQQASHEASEDDDEISDDSKAPTSGTRKSRRDDGDGNGRGDQERYKKRREQIAAASRASRARRKRELEDLRTETRILKEDRYALQETVRKLQKKLDDLQDLPLRVVETATKPNNRQLPNVAIELGTVLNSVTALLTCIRDKDCPSEEYVRKCDRLCRILAEEAVLYSRLVQPTTVTTPTGVEARGLAYPNFAQECCVVSIMRSGDILADALRHVFPTVPVGKFLIQRQEHLPNKPALLHWSKLPKDISKRFVFVCDPMLGTGGTIITCIQELVKIEVPPKNIVFINVVSCPEGLRNLYQAFPEVKVVTCAVDEALNDQCYIVPGLGDFGDRYYHTIPE